MQGLLHTELNLRDRLKDYIHRHELKLQKLKGFYEKTRDTDRYISESNVTLYSGNPLFIFKTIRRMTRDWMIIKEATAETDSFLYSLYDIKDSFPQEDDVDGATTAILRLQDTFDIPTRTIINGLESNSALAPKLAVDDVYQFAIDAYKQSNPTQSRNWMTEVLRMLNLDKTPFDFDAEDARFHAYDVLSWAEYQIGNIVASYNYTLELLKIEPEHTRIQENLELLAGLIKENNITEDKIQQDDDEIEKREEEIENEFPFYYTANENEGYRYLREKARANKLCRGETEPVPRKYRKYLICWLKQDHPRLILKPAKVERLYPRPEILMFRDVIRDTEIEAMKTLADPLLQRATVNNPVTGKLEPATYRVSKSAWLNRWDDPVLFDKMNQGIEDHTGLDMQHTEELQIANYGIGGFYEPHFDFARIVPLRPPPWEKRDNYTYLPVTPLHQRNTESGERVATWLFYLSDVQSGGATVFTNIGQAVTPSKGDAVFWYNLNHDGTGDYETRHAACPVLMGEKWVCNRWIHEFGQEFRRRCRLRHEDDWKMTKDGVFTTK